jgi:hypothetical protein
MGLLMPTAMRFYKIAALLGTLIVILVIVFSWMRIQLFENSVSAVFEDIVITKLEVDGLKQELIHIEKVLSVASELEGKKADIVVDDIPYSNYEIERLRNDKNNIQIYIKEKELDLMGSDGAKTHAMNEVRVLFVVSLSLLVLGTLMAAFGYIGWYFKLEFFEERRRNPR